VIKGDAKRREKRGAWKIKRNVTDKIMKET
jgi:hypothetical protein